MASLILELQADCLDSKQPVTSLLHKALVVSKKLGVPELEEWISSELNGYKDTVPAYRQVKGQIKAHNPYAGGWIPILYEDLEMGEMLSHQNMGQPIAELEDLVKGDKQTTLNLYYSDYIQQKLRQAGCHDFQCALQISSAKVKSLLNAVRKRVLDFALDLEARGIVGDGLTFSKEEKAAAAAVSYVTNNHIGEMHNSQLQQHAQHSPQTLNAGLDTKMLLQLVQDLQKATTKFELQQEQAQELAAELATLNSQAGSPKPKVSIVRESLKSVRTILEGAAGNVAASAFGERVIQLLQTLL